MRNRSRFLAEPLAGRHYVSGAATCSKQPGSPVKRLRAFVFPWRYFAALRLCEKTVSLTKAQSSAKKNKDGIGWRLSEQLPGEPPRRKVTQRNLSEFSSWRYSAALRLCEK